MAENRKFDSDKPYIFVSYSHRDKEAVEKTVGELFSRYGINIWYDVELFAGKNWDTVAIRALRSKNCMAVLYFASEDSLTSENVEKELDTACAFKKKIIPVNLTEKPFHDLVIDDINERYNDTEPEKVDVADRIVRNYLDSKLTYIVCDLDSEEYYHAIRRAIEHNAPGIEIREAGAAETHEEPEKASSETCCDKFSVQSKEMNVTFTKTDAGYILCAGSRICPTVDTNAPAKTKRARERLTSAGKLTDFTVADDIEFANSSALAAFCTGCVKSGAEFLKEAGMIKI